jgi:Sec-independent protein secretion pathway component TatC
MNLFNCYQALAFYTLVPFGIQWLTLNGHTAWAITAGVGEFVGFIWLGIALRQALDK